MVDAVDLVRAAGEAQGVSAVLGHTVPRVFTPPLVEGPPGPCGCGCALSADTSYGFDVEAFAADVLHAPLDPWERWVTIHAGELLPDGRPRFRKVLIKVARQNGKTHLLVVLSLFWLFVESIPMVLGTSTKLDYAKESWQKAVRMAKATPGLVELLPRNRNQGIRQANGEQEMVTTEGARYKIAPANPEGGRSLTLDRAILDELRQHHDYSAWDAIIPAGNAVRDFQAFCLSNEGSDRSVVMNDLTDAAEAFIESGEGDSRTGYFGYTCPEGSDPLDIHALALANPNLGRRIDAETLLSDAAAAVAKGGEKLVGFKVECMCMRVKLDTPPVIPAPSWEACLDPLSARVGPPALAVEVSPDRSLSSVSYAAARGDGLPMVQVVRVFPGVGQVVAEVAALAREKDATCVVVDGYGPVSSLIDDIREALAGYCPLEVLSTADMADACGSIYDAAVTEQLRHTGQAELNDAMSATVKHSLSGGRYTWHPAGSEDIGCWRGVTLALWGLSKHPGGSGILF